MADDLQNKTGTPSPSSNNSGGSTQNTSTSPALSNNVIDLRALDKKVPPTTSANGGTQTGTGATSAPQTSDDSFTSANGQTYTLPQNVREKFPDLMKLIKETESMNDEEREYWFQILPIMTDEQIAKFRDILVNERDQLAKLDKDYENELNKLNEKHMIEWKAFETKEKRKALNQAEQKEKAQEQAQEEDLLQRLSQI